MLVVREAGLPPGVDESVLKEVHRSVAARGGEVRSRGG